MYSEILWGNKDGGSKHKGGKERNDSEASGCSERECEERSMKITTENKRCRAFVLHIVGKHNARSRT